MHIGNYIPVLFVCVACVSEQDEGDVTNAVGENAGQGTTDDAVDHNIEESQGDSLAAGDSVSPRGSLQSSVSDPSQLVAVEAHRSDDESPKQSAKDADDEVKTATLMKSDQTSTKTGNSRAKNGPKCAEKKIWKPAGSASALSTQQSKKEAGSIGTSGRGKANRQSNASVPVRLPPISVSGMGSTDRRRQAAGEANGRGSNGVAAGRGAGLQSPPGRLYKCSATACVTVLSQPPDSIQQASANGDELSNGSADFSNRNRKYSSY